MSSFLCAHPWLNLFLSGSGAAALLGLGALAFNEFRAGRRSRHDIRRRVRGIGRPGDME